MDSEKDSQENARLESSMDMASLGSLEAAADFYRALLSGPLFIPDRHQTYPLSDQPDYPNDLVHILGVRDKDRAVVPVFSRKTYITEWCGAELECKVMTGRALLEAIPEGWWAVVNPGRAVEKELSPWELKRLHGGEECLPEVLEELKSGEGGGAITVKALNADEYLEVKRALVSAAAEIETISRVFLLKEESLEDEGTKNERLLAGVEAPDTTPEQRDRLRDQLQQTAAPYLIGDGPLSIIVERDVSQSMLLGLFQHAAPLYEAPRQTAAASWWRKLFKKS